LVEGIKKKTSDWWRTSNEVPAHRIIRLLKEQQSSQQEPVDEAARKMNDLLADLRAVLMRAYPKLEPDDFREIDEHLRQQVRLVTKFVVREPPPPQEDTLRRGLAEQIHRDRMPDAPHPARRKKRAG